MTYFFEVNILKKLKMIGTVLLGVSITMISVGMTLQAGQSGLKVNTIDIQEIDIKNMAASTNMIVKNVESEEKTEKENLLLTEVVMETAPASYIVKVKNFGEISTEEANTALYNGNLKMEYSALYTTSGSRLTRSKGAQYFNGHKETYYSQRVLPGNSLAIPGRHVADDGTVRDGDGFICVAADPGFMPKGSILITSLGPAKVYDCGCAYGTIDIYVNW